MKWFEPLIIAAIAAYFIALIVAYFVKKKKGTLRCECGHYRSQCVGDCSACNTASSIIDKYHNLHPKKGRYVYILNVETMQCDECEANIKIALYDKFEGIKVNVSSRRNIVKVKSKKVIYMKSLMQTLTSAGYHVTGIKLK